MGFCLSSSSSSERMYCTTSSLFTYARRPRHPSAEALERGAKALREINSSPHAKNVSVLPPSRPALTPISLPIPRSAKNDPDGWIDLDPIVTD